jgi:hypothetical protein
LDGRLPVARVGEAEIVRGLTVRTLVWLVVLVVLATAMAPAAVARPRMRVNGRVVDDERPLRVHGRTMVPARSFFRGIGGDVQWCDGECQVRRAGHYYRFRPRTNIYYYDKFPRYFPGESFVRGGRLYVPGDVVSDLGGRYYWGDSDLNIHMPDL